MRRADWPQPRGLERMLMIERDYLVAALALATGLWLGYVGMTRDVGAMKSHAVKYIARRFGPRAARGFVLGLALAFCVLGVAIAWPR